MSICLSICQSVCLSLLGLSRLLQVFGFQLCANERPANFLGGVKGGEGNVLGLPAFFFNSCHMMADGHLLLS